MKHVFFVLLLAACTVCGGEIIPDAGEIHPKVRKVLANYLPLQKGGYRIEKISDEQFIVVGIGKAPLKNNFFKAYRAAELDAELQIAKALNPTQITVTRSRSITTTVSSDGTVDKQTERKKFVKMLVSSHTPFIYSCGVWQHGKNLYCARAVFAGNYDHADTANTLSSRIVIHRHPTGNQDSLATADKFPFLSRGGTLLVNKNGKYLLLTVAIAPIKHPPVRRLPFAKNQAYKNMISFISGGKLEHQLNVISESYFSSSGNDRSRRSKRKALEASVKGEFQFIEPQAKWKIPGINYEFFLYTVELGDI